jgi:hypothetical protein
MMPYAKRRSKPRQLAPAGAPPDSMELPAGVRDLFRLVSDNMEDIQQLSVIAAEHKAQRKKPRLLRSA